MNLLDTLTRAADEEALVLTPLPAHALAEKPEHLRRHYALILAALLTAQPEVSEAQTRLLRLLLDALKLGDIRAALFEEARALTPEVLLEAARLVRDAAAAEELLVDALVLLRLSDPLSDDTSRLIAELAAFLGLDEATVATRVRDAQAILGLAGEGENQDSEQTTSPLAELWPSAIPRPLTLAALQAGLTGGLWYLDHDLTVTFPWRAENAVLLFRNGAQLNINVATQDKTIREVGFEGLVRALSSINSDQNISDQNIAQQGEVNLTHCRLTDPRVTVQGKVSLTVSRCTWQGRYDPEDEITALNTANITATISDSTFTLSGAQAISAQDGSLTVTGCQFIGCGCPTLDGGAIWLSENASRDITHSRFEACTAAEGGAIYISGYLRGIRDCEFVRCTSPGLKERGANDIALWARENYGDRDVIVSCIFRFCSIYVGKTRYSNSTGLSRQVAFNCHFDNGNFYYYEGNELTVARNCLFTNGRAIKLQHRL